MQNVPLFSTPIWNSKLPFLTRENKEKILKCLEQYNSDQPPKKNLAESEELEELFSYIYYACETAFLDLNLDQDGYQMSLGHCWIDHNSSKESSDLYHVNNGLFYGMVFLNCPQDSGNLWIYNQGMNHMWVGVQVAKEKNQYTSEKVKFIPEEGEIYIWPSHVPHSMERNTQKENRISLLFECNVIRRTDDVSPEK